MTRRRGMDDQELVEVHVTEEQLALLRSLDLDCREGLLDSQVRGRAGLCLRMSRLDLEDLVGWVAGEANHERQKGRAAMLHEIADEMEAVSLFRSR